MRKSIPMRLMGQLSSLQVTLPRGKKKGPEKGTQTFFASTQGKTVVENFDVVKQAGGIGRATTMELRGIVAARQLELRFVSKSRYAPMVSGVEVFRQERLEK